MGFTRVESLTADKVESTEAIDLLIESGYVHWFDVETGIYPNQHDSLMRALARLITPELDGAVFEERPPGLDDETSPYELTVYVGGKRYRIQAENLGDWYDVGAVLKIMNTVLENRRSIFRFNGVDTGDQTFIVVGAPQAAFTAAVQAKLLTPGNAGNSVADGKAFEEEVLKQLQQK